MTDHGISLNTNCPCMQQFCPIRGNCVLCVQNHLAHRRHIPECIQDMLRESVKTLAEKMEFSIEDIRPNDTYWKKMAETDFVETSKSRHRKADENS